MDIIYNSKHDVTHSGHSLPIVADDASIMADRNEAVRVSCECEVRCSTPLEVMRVQVTGAVKVAHCAHRQHPVLAHRTQPLEVGRHDELSARKLVTGSFHDRFEVRVLTELL